MSCCAVFCSSRSTISGVKNPEVSFHTFPKCPEIRNQWIKNIRRENWEPTKYSRICSKHFEDSCFMTGLQMKKLKSEAVPTIFLEYPKYFMEVTTKSKRFNETLELTPEKWRRTEASEDEIEDSPTTPMWAIKVLKSLSKARTIASRRLRLIHNLRGRIHRLNKKNAKLIEIVNALKKREFSKAKKIPNQHIEKKKVIRVVRVIRV